MIDMTNNELDKNVLEAIGSGLTRAGAVQAKLGLGQSATRDLDRSLQRLRRRGLIEYTQLSPRNAARGWQKTNQAV